MDQSKVNRLATVVIGCMLALSGMLIFFDPIYKSSFGWRFNFGEYHRFIGFGIFGLGVVILYFLLVGNGKRE